MIFNCSPSPFDDKISRGTRLKPIFSSKFLLIMIDMSTVLDCNCKDIARWISNSKFGLELSEATLYFYGIGNT